jgi:hypothetical protein
MSSTKIPKIQHYVPKFILRNFTERKNQIWVFDKQNNRKFKTNIKNVASESGFYDLELLDHKVTLETSIAKFESKCSGIIKNIVRNESLANVTDKDKLALSRFLALQLVRTMQYRNHLKSMTEEFAKTIREKGWNPKNLEGFKELTNEEAKFEHMRSVYQVNVFLPYFYNKVWVLQKTIRKHTFWISDNPISFQNMNDYRILGNIGLNVKGIEIYFPLTKNLSLGLWCPNLKEQIEKIYIEYKFISQASPEDKLKIMGDLLYCEQLKEGFDNGHVIPLKHESIINLNSLQVKYAARFIYSNNEDFSLAEIILRSHPNFRKGPRANWR